MFNKNVLVKDKMKCGYRVKNQNGINVCICEECYKGNHNTISGKSHFGVKDREDCKEVFIINGIVYQCSCGMGGKKLEKKEIV